jgi:hypothetical protein
MMHIIKLCVGADSVEDLAEWQRRQIIFRREAGLSAVPVCNTRMTPAKADAVLAGGSLYWVIRGIIEVRQAITGIETLPDGARTRCEFLLDPALVRVRPVRRRAFQGWRYLAPGDAPSDLAGQGASAGDVPEELARRLVEIGAW